MTTIAYTAIPIIPINAIVIKSIDINYSLKYCCYICYCSGCNSNSNKNSNSYQNSNYNSNNLNYNNNQIPTIIVIH